jgi:hypothetical protein
MKIINHWREKSKKASEDGKNFHAHGLVEAKKTASSINADEKTGYPYAEDWN